MDNETSIEIQERSRRTKSLVSPVGLEEYVSGALAFVAAQRPAKLPR